MNKIAGMFLILSLLVLPATGSAAERESIPETCTYTVRVWNTNAGKVTRTERVEKLYSEVTDIERDRSGTGCTVCTEDQVKITLSGVEPFYACHAIVDKVEAALLELLEQNEPVLAISGYRPVRSKGALNPEGERTELSNHAFGAAIDINRMQNGLYKNCYEWGPKCKLAMGGAWRPGKTKGSLSPDGAIVMKLKSLGFKWGGEIRASQKDFMHFSFSGM